VAKAMSHWTGVRGGFWETSLLRAMNVGTTLSNLLSGMGVTFLVEMLNVGVNNINTVG
jgi:hypothetical protein